MIQYPLRFSARAVSQAGIQADWTIAGGGFETRCSIPPEFEGPGGAFSPEDLFAMALTNCFVATFKVYAEESKVTFSSVEADSELFVDIDDSGKPVMKKLVLHAKLHGASNPERVRALAQRAFKSGFILNSVKTELHLDLQIVD